MSSKKEGRRHNYTETSAIILTVSAQQLLHQIYHHQDPAPARENLWQEAPIPQSSWCEHQSHWERTSASSWESSKMDTTSVPLWPFKSRSGDNSDISSNLQGSRCISDNILYYLNKAGQQGMSHCSKIWSAICLDMDLCPNSCLHGLRNINTEVQQQVLKYKAYKEERKLTQ